MPTTSGILIPKPRSWDELEVIVWALFCRIWHDDHAQRFGREGQRQHGIDILGRPVRDGQPTGVQVKKRFRSRVTEKELRREVDGAKGFPEPLGDFILVTSAPRDESIQTVALRVTEEHQQAGLFHVHVYGWEDVEERLGEFPELLQQHYSQFYPGRPAEEVALLKKLVELKTREAAESEERDRPKFQKVPGGAVTTLEARFTPQWTIKQVSGERVTDLEWRFRGPRFQMDWRAASGAVLDRTSVRETFDLTAPPQPDDVVGLDDIGLEIRFFWRGKCRHELHRWPITRRVLPAEVMWDVGEELLPPLYFDGPDCS